MLQPPEPRLNFVLGMNRSSERCARVNGCSIIRWSMTSSIPWWMDSIPNGYTSSVRWQGARHATTAMWTSCSSWTRIWTASGAPSRFVSPFFNTGWTRISSSSLLVNSPSSQSTNAHSTTPYWTRGYRPTTGDADARPCSVRVYRRTHGNDRYTVAVAHGICDSTTRLFLNDSAYPHAVIIAPVSESPPFGFPRHVSSMRFIVQKGH